ncbi:MAG: hypothetical protein J4N87_06410 [Chloroflexi bacterium]|nr:hypothetical protein [Chloroflexota bacterium]
MTSGCSASCGLAAQPSIFPTSHILRHARTRSGTSDTGKFVMVRGLLTGRLNFLGQAIHE